MKHSFYIKSVPNTCVPDLMITRLLETHCLWACWWLLQYMCYLSLQLARHLHCLPWICRHRWCNRKRFFVRLLFRIEVKSEHFDFQNRNLRINSEYRAKTFVSSRVMEFTSRRFILSLASELFSSLSEWPSHPPYAVCTINVKRLWWVSFGLLDFVPPSGWCGLQSGNSRNWLLKTVF